MSDMFKSYQKILDDYIPCNRPKEFCEPEQDIVLGSVGQFTEVLELTRDLVLPINSLGVENQDLAIYFIFKNGIDVLYKKPAVVIENPAKLQPGTLLATCTLTAQETAKINPHLNLFMQLKIILIDGSIIYTNKKRFKVITPIDYKGDQE